MKSNSYLPPEWEQHRATWLCWPHATDTWPSDVIGSVHRSFADFIKVITQGELVELIVQSNEHRLQVENLLESKNIVMDKVRFHTLNTNDSWMRDIGCDFIYANNRKTAVSWEFNAWGEKYLPFDLDNAVSGYMANSSTFPKIYRKIVLEGGSFEVNGNGVLMTTESCLLNVNRNGFSRSEAEKVLIENFGVEKFIWLKEGIMGDDTDGHIDDVARFINQNTIVIGIEEAVSDENFSILKSNYELLLQIRNTWWPELEIVTIPMPGPLYYDGQRIPASYLNFYIANAAIIVPVFGDNNDRVAIETLSGIVKDRPVIGIDATDVVVGLGSWHCLSKHECK